VSLRPVHQNRYMRAPIFCGHYACFTGLFKKSPAWRKLGEEDGAALTPPGQDQKLAEFLGSSAPAEGELVEQDTKVAETDRGCCGGPSEEPPSVLTLEEKYRAALLEGEAQMSAVCIYSSAPAEAESAEKDTKVAAAEMDGGCFFGALKKPPSVQKLEEEYTRAESEGEDQIPAESIDASASAMAELVNNTTTEATAVIAAKLRSELWAAARSHFSTTRSPLTQQEEDWMTDELLGVYVRARPTLEERVAILAPALTWRIAHREVLATRRCLFCEADPLSHDARLFGFDREGDYVFMNCFELPRDITVDSVERHVICLLERALGEFNDAVDVLEADGHPRTRRWTFIFDLYGFGLRYWDPRVSLRLLDLFQVAHRGRLKKFLVLDAPGMFGGFYSLVQPFMKPATGKKIQFSDWKTILPQLKADFGEPLAEELWAEAQENRAQKVAKKTWTTFYGPSLGRHFPTAEG